MTYMELEFSKKLLLNLMPKVWQTRLNDTKKNQVQPFFVFGFFKNGIINFSLEMIDANI